MAQEKAQVQKQGRKQEQDDSEEQVQFQETTLGDDVEDLLEEIDSVLEENAETFVREYCQKGGQ